MPVAGDGPVLQREPHEPPRHALALLAPERGGADELALRRLDRPPQPNLERGRRRVHIVPVEEEAGFEPERVARPQAGREYPVAPALRQNGVPQVDGVPGIRYYWFQDEVPIARRPAIGTSSWNQ